ncbi:hypothetical protein SAMN04489737_0513 [Arcanobacterium phocae]|uniref:Uncharacterized protein n=1 Tax=Arcanobacterium phocae TaxID=131112 RepID=A0A1H2LD37_9ACTO|nr:hypothetical protein [Arcanobacterium phocae]SDU78538.1 hypothetical protein SAMN04489737_0513 [Arcanobacterium phocae]
MSVDIAPLHLRDVVLSARFRRITRRHLFRADSYRQVLEVQLSIGDHVIVFQENDFSADMISLLLTEPGKVIFGNDPFLCGVDYPGSAVAEIARAYHVDVRNLVVITKQQVLATIYQDEIPALHRWLDNVFS